MPNQHQSTDSITNRKRGLAVNLKPLLCGVCGLEFDACDREIAELARMRHYRTVHQIRDCEPEFWQ